LAGRHGSGDERLLHEEESREPVKIGHVEHHFAGVGCERKSQREPRLAGHGEPGDASRANIATVIANAAPL